MTSSEYSGTTYFTFFISGRARSTATESDADSDTGSIASDETDGGVYVHVNVYVLNWDKCCTRCFPPVYDSDHILVPKIHLFMRL